MCLSRDIQRHDAVGNFCRQIRAYLSARGYDVRLAAENCHPADRSAIELPSDIVRDIAADDVVMFHFSTHDPAFAALAALDNAKILYFHNITPDVFFAETDRRTADLVQARAGAAAIWQQNSIC